MGYEALMVGLAFLSLGATNPKEIPMPAHIENMAYVGEVPWHGLGTALTTPPATTQEAMVAGGLDWEVVTAPMYLHDSFGGAAGRLVDERRTVVRKTDGAILGTVGPDWTPIQNKDAFKPFEPFLASGEVQVETVGSLNGGRRVWMLGKVQRPDEVIVPGSDDRVAKYLLAAVGHDGTLSYHCGETGIRVVCMNTLGMALSENGRKRTMIKIRHTKNGAANVAAVRDEIQKIDARFGQAATIFRALATVSVTAESLRRYIDSVFPVAKPKQVEAAPTNDLATLLARPLVSRERSSFVTDPEGMTKETKRRIYGEIETLFEGGRGNDMKGVRGTAWGAYNAVTEYLTWERGNSVDRRLEHVWLHGAGPAVEALPAAMVEFLGMPRNTTQG